MARELSVIVYYLIRAEITSVGGLGTKVNNLDRLRSCVAVVVVVIIVFTRQIHAKLNYLSLPVS